MLNIELFELQRAFAEVRNLKGASFAYGIARNRGMVDKRIEELQEAITQSDEYKAYDKERMALCTTHAVKNEDDQPKIEAGNFVIDDQEKFAEELSTLSEKYTEVIAEYKTKEEDYKDLLQQDCDLELYMIDFANVPEDISVIQMNALMPIISND